jgi:hypothetical protein
VANDTQNADDGKRSGPTIGKDVLRRLVKASASPNSFALVRDFIRDTTIGGDDATSDR